jgi:hypothetical protein
MASRQGIDVILDVFNLPFIRLSLGGSDRALLTSRPAFPLC